MRNKQLQGPRFLYICIYPSAGDRHRLKHIGRRKPNVLFYDKYRYMNVAYTKRLCKSLWRDIKRPTYKGIKRVGIGDTWFPSFIIDRLQYDQPHKVACFTVNSFPELVKWDNHPYKFLYIGENVHVPFSHWAQFEDIQNSRYAPDLTMGFDNICQDNYLRFPYWLVDNFTPLTSFREVQDFVQKYNSAPTDRKNFCAFICRYDYFGDRALIADMVESVAPLSYPSGFRHNDDRMHHKYKNDKITYLNSFRFNLCPENSNNAGYVTEKIFHAVKAGCIPIYWGNEGLPETGILNKDAIIYLDKEHPEDALSLIKLLNTNPKAYAEFAAQPRFVPHAADEIYAYYERLETKLKTILGIS